MKGGVVNRLESYGRSGGMKTPENCENVDCKLAPLDCISRLFQLPIVGLATPFGSAPGEGILVLYIYLFIYSFIHSFIHLKYTMISSFKNAFTNETEGMARRRLL